MTPKSLFRTVAIAEAITWTALISGLVIRAVVGGDTGDLAVRIGGSIHGFVFLCYVVATLAVWTDKKWSAGTGVLGLASAVIPYATVPFERSVERRGLLDGPWRLAPGGEAPRTLPERLLAFALRSPVVALLVTLVVVAVVFTLLLWAGKPTEWFS